MGRGLCLRISEAEFCQNSLRRVPSSAPFSSVASLASLVLLLLLDIPVIAIYGLSFMQEIAPNSRVRESHGVVPQECPGRSKRSYEGEEAVKFQA